MGTQLLQIINLILSYNSNKSVEDDLFDNDIFKFFTDPINKDLEKLNRYVRTPNDWSSGLRTKGCKKLCLGYLQDDSRNESYENVGFANSGVKWIIEAQYKHNNEYWLSNWSVKKFNEASTIWEVAYFQIDIDEGVIPSIIFNKTVKEQKDELLDILLKLSQFATENQYTKCFVTDFQNAIQCLDRENPAVDPGLKLIPDGSLRIENYQLLDAASKAFVFGGMGSWNDVGLNEDINYQILSALLYKTLNESFVVAVNN